MTREQALALINAINAIHDYVPPIHFRPIAQSDAVRLIGAVAVGTASLQFAIAAPAPAAEPDRNQFGARAGGELR